MPPTRKFPPKNPGGKTRFSIPFSAPLAIAAALVLVCAVGWSFFIGFMVGKGQNPETRINAMTGGLLESDKIEPESQPEPPLENVPPGETASPPPPRAETLPAQVKPGATETAPGFLSGPQGNARSAWGPTDAASSTSPAKRGAEPKKDVKKEARPETPRFEYSFQVAAFKTQKEADSLARRLRGQGIRGRVAKTGKVALVVADLRGSEEEAANLRQKLKGLKLGTPLQLSKKQITPKKTRGK